VSAAPIGDRRLDFGPGYAVRVGLYVGKGIGRRCRRRRPRGKEPTCNQAAPDRFTVAVTMPCRVVQGSHDSRASLVGRHRLSLNWPGQQHQRNNAIDAHVGHDTAASNAQPVSQPSPLMMQVIVHLSTSRANPPHYCGTKRSQSARIARIIARITACFNHKLLKPVPCNASLSPLMA
jgi:hypothetical protein